MKSRLALHEELVKVIPNAYFQPPSNLTMKYPCIVYGKRPKDTDHANNAIYRATQGYQLTVITKDADSDIADQLTDVFQHCSITNHFTIDNLHHTLLNLYY